MAEPAEYRMDNKRDIETNAPLHDDGPERTPDCGLRWLAPSSLGKLLHTCERYLGHEGRHRCSCGRSRVP